MNAFLNTHRQECKNFVDTICAISPDQANSAIPASYATPITILGRLPGTSREGFPSLPYLIDQAKQCAALVELWLDGPHNTGWPRPMSDDLTAFNDMCETSREKAKHCLSRAEQAERPSGLLEPKWEELVEQMGRKARIRIANGQKSSEPVNRASAEETRRKTRVRIQSGYSSSDAPTKERGSREGTQNSSTTSLVSSYFHRNNASGSSSVHERSMASGSTTRTISAQEDGEILLAYDVTKDGAALENDDDDYNSTEAAINTPPGSSSAVWDPGVRSTWDHGVRSTWDHHSAVPNNSGDDMEAEGGDLVANDDELGSSIYRIGTPSSPSSRRPRHHLPPRSGSRQKSSEHHRRAGGRSAYTIDTASELSGIPKRSPVNSRDGMDPPPNGKSIYRLRTPTAADRQLDPVPRSITPRSPGSRDGGKFSFGDFGSVFRKRAKEREREVGW